MITFVKEVIVQRRALPRGVCSWCDLFSVNKWFWGWAIERRDLKKGEMRFEDEGEEKGQRFRCQRKRPPTLVPFVVTMLGVRSRAGPASASPPQGPVFFGGSSFLVTDEAGGQPGLGPLKPQTRVREECDFAPPIAATPAQLSARDANCIDAATARPLGGARTRPIGSSGRTSRKPRSPPGAPIEAIRGKRRGRRRRYSSSRELRRRKTHR